MLKFLGELQILSRNVSALLEENSLKLISHLDFDLATLLGVKAQKISLGSLTINNKVLSKMIHKVIDTLHRLSFEERHNRIKSLFSVLCILRIFQRLFNITNDPTFLFSLFIETSGSNITKFPCWGYFFHVPRNHQKS